MAIGWLTVLKMVPWGDVIESAPKVAVGAKKLWDKVGKKPTDAPGTDATTTTPLSPEATLAQLQQQVAALQERTRDLHQQMVESSALIASLAEQNTQLIARVELNRKRLLTLALLTLGLAVTCAVLYFR